MPSVLVSWIGQSDLKASGPGSIGESRIYNVVAEDFFANVALLSHHNKKSSRTYKKWLSGKVGLNVDLDRRKLRDAFDFAEVYRATTEALDECLARYGDEDVEFDFLLGSDSPFMDAVFIALAYSAYDAELIYWDADEGVRVIEPASEDLEQILGQTTQRRTRRIPFSDFANFDAIVHAGEAMSKVVKAGRRVAAIDVPVLIIGEAGTGRELFARAIHKESNRERAPFVHLDIEAVPTEDHERVLFGSDGHDGLVNRAYGGILFLDRIEALSKGAQATLFRVLREGRFVGPEGNDTEVELRVIASSEIPATELVPSGALRDDLFHRLAIGIIELPPLRERGDDLDAMIRFLLGTMNKELDRDLQLSAEAEAVLHAHHWPGNIRELNATLRRASIWADGTIEAHHVQDAILPVSTGEESVLTATLNAEFDIKDTLDDIARHYVERALEETHGNKTQAATLLGLNNYQTLSNWMKRLGVS